VFKNKVLRNILGLKRVGRNKRLEIVVELHDIHPSPNIRMIN